MRALLALLACAAALARCAMGPAANPCPEHGYAVVTQAPASGVADPRQPSDLLYVAQGLEPAFSPRLDVAVAAGGPQGRGSGAP